MDLQKAIEALKKQTPKKPKIWNVSEKGKMTNTYYFCYICDNLLSRSCHEYCPGCGQAIDWE